MISLKAAEDINLKAAQNIRMQAEAKDISAKAGRDLYVTTQRNTEVDVRNGDAEINVASGNLRMQAAKEISFKGQAGGNITIAQADGSIDIDTEGNIAVEGPAVSITGKSIDIDGSATDNNS
jgi:uncharacterized protein (DUF2345 family)